MTNKRLEKIINVAKNRQCDMTVVLNNVHDPHNIGAVLRTCDAVGIGEVYVYLNEDTISEENIQLGKRASSSARKWVDVFLYNDLKYLIKDLKAKYKTIVGTHLSSESTSIYEVDLTEPIALIFGNEHCGISEELITHLDKNIIIPQVGMVESLNISVSVAITLYEAYRQRNLAGLYNKSELSESVKTLSNEYIERSRDSLYGSFTIKR